MNPTTHTFATVGALVMAIAVALGAFGAHALRDRVVADLLVVWQTAVQYHVYHALGLFVVAGVAFLLPENSGVRLSGWLMTAGIVLFSGSLYVLVLTGVRWLGAVTPLGGTALIAAWLLLAWSVWRA
ncbi:MAG: DUF423 domain-containing protein [bacterium]|nr:DUF423 domain-containing protein [bacterium]